MVDLGSLAARLADAADVTAAAEALAEHLVELVPGGAVRVYLLRPGDLCPTCHRAADCTSRDRCLHLEASLGAFARPPGHVDRIPLDDPVWAGAVSGRAPETPLAPPLELEAADASEPPDCALLVPLPAGGRVVGIVGLRCPMPPAAEVEARVRTAAFLAAAAFRLLMSLEREGRRSRQLMLVSDLGHKVNSILDDELLLRQAAADIQRTFGFHNVMIFMRADDDRTLLVLKAQASSYDAPSHLLARVDVDQGVVGRVFRRGTAEVVRNVADDPDFLRWYPDTQAEIGVPIKIAGEVVGVLNVESDRVGGFGEDERLVLETVANQLAIAIENARLFGLVREREDRYRELVESNPGAVIHLDAQGAITFVNPAAVDLTGRARDDLILETTSLTSLVLEESRDRLHEAIAGAIGGTRQNDVEFHLQHADGRVRTASASFQPLLDEEGDTLGVVVLAQDRTRERELQDRLYQSEKLSAIGGLVSGVAHELNNPLAGILGFAQLLLSRPTEEWTVRDVEKIEKNARRCQKIVENLLAFARQAKLSRRMANLNEIIDSVLRLNEYQLHMDDVEVQRDFDLRTPPLLLDVNRWQQVFVNLASNAHQAIVAAKSEKRVIRFETRAKEGRVIVRVTDTGPGIPPDVRARIFEPFFTTKDTGTGLGLGICYGIVTEHGGTIELEPPGRGGTCFRITLPFEARPEMPPAPQAEAGPARSDRGAGRRVLVVDDEENVCDVVARALQNHGYSVDTVGDGQSALDQIEEHAYDAVLTDVSMPGPYKGIDLYDRVAEDRPALAERIIFLTGHRHDDVLEAQIEARGGRCIEKPFDIRDLARVVNDVAAADDGETPGLPSPDE